MDKEKIKSTTKYSNHLNYKAIKGNKHKEVNMSFICALIGVVIILLLGFRGMAIVSAKKINKFLLGFSLITLTALFPVSAAYAKERPAKSSSNKGKLQGNGFAFWSKWANEGNYIGELRFKTNWSFVGGSGCNMSYKIIMFPFVAKRLAVCLRILDKDGFEVDSFRIGNIEPNYTGTLKGNIELRHHKDYKKIRDAELFFYTR